MVQVLNRMRSATVEAAMRVKVETPVGVFLIAAIAGYLAVCIATYVTIVG
jgi:hypothetical protein